MPDIGVSALSLIFMQSESFLAYQRGLEQKHMSSNGPYGLSRLDHPF